MECSADDGVQWRRVMGDELAVSDGQRTGRRLCRVRVDVCEREDGEDGDGRMAMQPNNGDARRDQLVPTEAGPLTGQIMAPPTHCAHFASA
jgi:hypothetical protein